MRLRYVLDETFSNMVRNVAMAISVVIVTAVSLAFVGAGILMQKQIDIIRTDLLSQSQVTVFLCSRYSTAPTCASGAATAAQQEEIGAALDGPELQRYISGYELRTQEEALAAYQEQFGDDAFAQQASIDDMPVSFHITLKDPERSAAVVEFFSGRQGVDEVTDLLAVYEPMIRILNQLTVVTAAFAGFMLFAAILLVVTTIRMSAANRRRETEIMRFVGASNLFIRLPFILEAAIASVIGSVIASGVLFVGVQYGVEEWLAPRLSGQIRFIATSDALLTVPWLVAAGTLLAVVASMVSLNRYLKV